MTDHRPSRDAVLAVRDRRMEQLRAERDDAREAAAFKDRRIESLHAEIERLEGVVKQADATLDRVRAAVACREAIEVTDWERGYRACARRAVRALGETTEENHQ